MNPEFTKSQIEYLEPFKSKENKNNKFYTQLKNEENDREKYRELLQLAIIHEK